MNRLSTNYLNKRKNGLYKHDTCINNYKLYTLLIVLELGQLQIEIEQHYLILVGDDIFGVSERQSYLEMNA